jgi:Ca-activated chloride channel family protein
MRAGIEAALSSLRDGALRQVILVSDGQIGFESQILSQLAKHLPASCRFHCLGVGHAANAALLVPAARAGRGRCMIVAPGEDAEPACKRMLAHTAAPQVVKLSVSGGALASAPERVQDLYAGAPLQLALALRAGGGTLEVHGETAEGPYSTSLTVAPREAGSGSARLLALYARERIEDVELALAAGTCQLAEADREIEALGVDFQVASRLTSWVAVSENVSVDGTHATRRVEQPHVLAAGMSAEGLGLRAPMAFASVPTSALFAGVAVAGAAPPSMRSRAMFGAPPASAAPPSAKAETSLFARVKRVFSSGSEPGELSEPVHSMADFRSLQDIVELRGKIRIHNEQRLAITIELPRALTWELPARVSVQLADGSVVELDVERSASTQSGQLQAGQSVRLVCRLQAPLATAPETLFFEQPHDARWVVTLEA